MSHLSPETLGALRDRALDGGARRAAERHLESCAECRDALARLVTLEHELAGALEHDPGDVYFESFAARVADRLRAEGAPRRAAAPAGGWWRELFAPRGLALVGSVAAVAVVAVLVYVQSQEQRSVLATQAARDRAMSQASPQAETRAKKEPSADDKAAREGAAGTDAGHARGDAAFRATPVPPPATLDRRVANAPPADGAPSRDEDMHFAPAPEPTLAEEKAQAKAAPSENAAPAPSKSKALGAPAPSATGQLQTIPASGAREDRIAGADQAKSGAPSAPSAATPYAKLTSNEKQEVATTDALTALKLRALGPLQQQRASDALAKSSLGAHDAQGVQAGQVAAAGGLVPPPRWSLGAWPAPLRPLAASADSVTRLAWSRGVASAKDVIERAAAHEAAARAWDRVRAASKPKSAADAEARLRVAEETYAAWTVDPTGPHAAAARAALRSADELASPETRANYLTPLLTMLP